MQSNNLPQLSTQNGMEKMQDRMQQRISLLRKLPFTKDFMEILERKYKAVPVGELPEDQLKIIVLHIMARINVITGWTIPEPPILHLLRDSFCEFLKQKYATMNQEEIAVAFMIYGTEVIDYGKSMNLNLIDQVLTPYMLKRFDASMTEEREVTKAKMKSEEMQLEKQPVDCQAILDSAWNIWRAKRDLFLLPIQAYSVLKAHGIAPTEKEKVEIKKNAQKQVSMLFASDTYFRNNINRDECINTTCKRLWVDSFFKRFQDEGQNYVNQCLKTS